MPDNLSSEAKSQDHIYARLLRLKPAIRAHRALWILLCATVVSSLSMLAWGQIVPADGTSYLQSIQPGGTLDIDVTLNGFNGPVVYGHPEDPSPCAYTYSYPSVQLLHPYTILDHNTGQDVSSSIIKKVVAYPSSSATWSPGGPNVLWTLHVQFLRSFNVFTSSYPYYSLGIGYDLKPPNCTYLNEMAYGVISYNVDLNGPQFFLSAPLVPPPNLGPCDGSASRSGCSNTPEPIDPSTGNEVFSEADDYISGDGRLKLTRTYNSAAANDTLAAANADMGPGWGDNLSVRRIDPINRKSWMLPRNSISTNFQTPSDACTLGWPQIASSVPNSQGVTATYDANSGLCDLSNGQTLPVLSAAYSSQPGYTAAVSAERPGGSQYFFTCPSAQTTCTATPGVALSLGASGQGYTLTDEDDTVESYSVDGSLQSLTYRGGYIQAFSYQNGQLASVVDSFGRSLSYQYSNGVLQSVTTPSGTIQYAYDALGRLVTVTYPGGATRSYGYNNAQYPNALTSVTDENGAIYATVTYDSQGRASQSSLTGGAWAASVDYTNPSAPVVTDAFNVGRTYQFSQINGQPKLTAIQGSPCNTCQGAATTTYDSAGYYQSKTDWNGITTQYVYDDSRGLETSRIEAYGTAQARTITTQWHPQFREPTLVSLYAGGSATGTPVRTTSFTYDPSGNMLTKTVSDITVTPSVSRTWTYTYDSYGNILTADGPRTDAPDITTFAYYACSSGSQCGQLRTLTNAAGQVTTFNTYSADGQPLTTTDANGVATTMTYDARQHLTSRSVAGETTTFSYYPTELLKQVTLADGSFLKYSYNNAHQLTAIQDGLGDSVQYTVDAMSNPTVASVYDPSNTMVRTSRKAYNVFDELYQDIPSAGTAAVTTTFSYDANGNQTGVSAPLSRSIGKNYDALNRVIQIRDPATGQTGIAYDADNRVLSVTDARGLVTSYTYNWFGDLLTRQSPDTGLTTKTYDSAGNLSTSTDARGAVSTYTYDALNRVASLSYSLAGHVDQSIAFTYDSGTNGVGRLTGASDGNHSLSWSYDASGRVVGKTQTVAGVTRSVGYTYTSGDLTTLTTPSGQTITYSYNGNHQVVGISVNGTGVLSAATYQPFGSVSGWTWGNGTTVVRSYDQDGNIAQIASGGETYQYTRDNASRITGISNSADSSLSWSYGYDSLDRLTSASSIGDSETYGYTLTGTRNAWTFNNPSGSGSGTYVVDPQSNRITSISLTGSAGSMSTAVQYDTVGNVISEWGSAATYNGAGRSVTLSGVATVQVLYNALSQRILKVTPAGTTVFVYDENGHLLGEYDGTGALIEETVWLGDTPVATLQPNAGGTVATYYIHSDHLNSPRKISIPSNNQLVWRWDSDPFADQQPDGDPLGTGQWFTYNLGFPGQYFDEESGLTYNYYRYYDPLSGTYLQSDPIGLLGGINTYAYANGNPVSRIDPSGLFTMIFISYSSGIGDHASVYTSRGDDGKPAFYDPAGGFNAEKGGDLQILFGKDADIPGYLDYQLQSDDRVDAYYFATTQQEEQQIIQNATDLPYAQPFQCASRTSKAIQGVGPFKSITQTALPGNLANQLYKLPGSYLFRY